MQTATAAATYGDLQSLDALRADLRRIKDSGVDYAAMGQATGVNRSTISQLVNRGLTTTYRNLDALRAYADRTLAALGESAAPADAPHADTVGLWPTAEHLAALGMLQYIRDHRKMGVLIGAPGTGKTTALKRYMSETPGVIYIEAVPSMRVGDLLTTIADGAGLTLPRGNAYTRYCALVDGLQERNDVMVIVDEAEYLRKWDVDKFEYLRKLWDNTGTPTVLCGTPVLADLLKRGRRGENLAQLYRRKYELQLKGITADEALTYLRQYDCTTDALQMLSQIGADAAHGGLGTMVEILEMCLEAAGGSTIDAATVRAARRHKLMG